MTQSSDQNADGFHSMAPLLSAESADEFASLRKAFENEIHPVGSIEQMYVDDFAELIFEIRRLRRYKTAIINSSRLAALQGILKQLLYSGDFEFAYVHEQAAEELARDWFKKKSAKTKVATLLRIFGLDEEAIDAGAFRLCSEDVERLDRMLALAEARRDKALRSVAELRLVLSKQLKQAAGRVLNEEDEVPRLVAVVKRPD